MAVEVRPATVFDDVAEVIGPERPGASVCFCLSHRIPAKQNQALKGAERGELVRRLCREEPPPGVLARDGDVPVGWAGIAPRSATQFARSTRIPHVDDLPVWSLWCVRVRAGHRGGGITAALIEGAVAFAAEHGAPVVEAYPVDSCGKRVDSSARGVVRARRVPAGGGHDLDARRVPAGGDAAGSAVSATRIRSSATGLDGLEVSLVERPSRTSPLQQDESGGFVLLRSDPAGRVHSSRTRSGDPSCWGALEGEARREGVRRRSRPRSARAR